ncbi:hypothetical protein NDU88_002468 [Pleurodeles waltl]|uniref:Uncharacterized protein n=1 Tax=Pleurodeles waltl TaxID=8319 RepID=A0AAV7UYQ9_PLEWA|nr:hypothetical protein NDU88_002468 [Pleurodeles waltl]
MRSPNTADDSTGRDGMLRPGALEGADSAGALGPSDVAVGGKWAQRTVGRARRVANLLPLPALPNGAVGLR